MSSKYRVIYLEGSDVRRSLGYNADDMMDQEGKIRWEYRNQDSDERFEQLAEALKKSARGGIATLDVRGLSSDQIRDWLIQQLLNGDALERSDSPPLPPGTKQINTEVKEEARDEESAALQAPQAE